MTVDVSELIGITSAELFAISHILNAAYSEGVRVQCGWEGPLPQVQQLAHAYKVAAKEAALREAQFEKDATDTAIRDAVEYFLKTRREKRGY
jgi:hypothetical protein